MIRFTNSLKKVKVAALGVASSLVIASCGSYQPVSYDNDGIYGNNRQNQQRVATPVNANTAAPVANSNSYFTQKLNEYENAASGGEVLTDIENYSSQYYDESQVNNDNAYYPGWGQDTQQSTVQVNANVGWGYNNFNPFWNRGYRNGWNRWGSGWNNWAGGWNDPFFNGGFYGNGFYGGGFYAGGFYGNNFWFGNGFYNNRFNNRYYGNRRYANNRSNVNTAVGRNYTPRYSGSSNSARSSSARSSARTYTPRQSSSNTSARSSSSSNRTYSPRSSSSSSSNRSYSPRSSSSSNNRSSSSSARSSRSSSSRSSSGGTYRRR